MGRTLLSSDSRSANGGSSVDSTESKIYQGRKIKSSSLVSRLTYEAAGRGTGRNEKLRGDFYKDGKAAARYQFDRSCCHPGSSRIRIIHDVDFGKVTAWGELDFCDGGALGEADARYMKKVRYAYL